MVKYSGVPLPVAGGRIENADGTMIECNENGQNGTRLSIRAEFCDVTRVVFHPVFKIGVLRESYVMVWWRLNTDIFREEKIIDSNIEALRFHRDDLDETLQKITRAYDSRANLWMHK